MTRDILTVTLNPAIDRYYYIDGFGPGYEGKTDSGTISAGGKGINVSRALKSLGLKNTATGICGGKNGALLRELLCDEKIPADFCDAKGETRVNITIVDPLKKKQTRILESGPRVGHSDLKRFKARFKQLVCDFDAVIFSGSLARDIPTDYYGKLIKMAKANGRWTVLDTSGTSLAKGISAGPDILKINNDEADALLGRRLRSVSARTKALKELQAKGVKIVMMSLGKNGAVAYNGQEVLWACPPKMTGGSDVGCGDAMFGGYFYGLKKGSSFAQCLRYAVAAGTASLCSDVPGMIVQKEFFRIVKCVKVDQF